MKDEVRYQRVAAVPGLVLSLGRFAQFSFERHYHLDCHIGIVTEGVQRQRYQGRTEHIGPDCIALMPPGVIHDGVCEGGGAYTLRTFRIPGDLLRTLGEEIVGTPQAPELPAMTIKDGPLAGRLAALHRRLQSGREDPLGLQTEWLATLRQLFDHAHLAAPGPDTAPLSDAQWRYVRDYCMTHLADKLTLDELAALCGLERFPFLRQFKRTMGMTLHAWLLRMRLERACSLLGGKAGTLATIAQDVGFFDQSHFNRAFRQAFGVAPSRY